MCAWYGILFLGNTAHLLLASPYDFFIEAFNFAARFLIQNFSLLVFATFARGIYFTAHEPIFSLNMLVTRLL